MRTSAILNLKGGVAKTSTAVNVAAILASDYKQRVLLVDDICTTGATLRECVRVLKDAGAEGVVCVATAKTRKK